MKLEALAHIINSQLVRLTDLFFNVWNVKFISQPNRSWGLLDDVQEVATIQSSWTWTCQKGSKMYICSKGKDNDHVSCTAFSKVMLLHCTQP